MIEGGRGGWQEPTSRGVGMVGGKRERGDESQKASPGSLYKAEPKATSIEGVQTQRMTSVLSPSVVRAGEPSAYILQV